MSATKLAASGEIAASSWIYKETGGLTADWSPLVKRYVAEVIGDIRLKIAARKINTKDEGKSLDVIENKRSKSVTFRSAIDVDENTACYKFQKLLCLDVIQKK